MQYVDYDEMYYEPSAADQIVNEASDKLKQLLTDEIRNGIEESTKALAEEKANNECLLKENIRLKSELRNANENIKKAVDAAIDDLYTKLMGDLELGQKVYFINSTTKYRKCSICGGTQKLKVVAASKVKKTIECPKCNKKGNERIGYSYFVLQGTVDNIECILQKGGYRRIDTKVKHTDRKTLFGADASCTKTAEYMTSLRANEIEIEDYAFGVCKFDTWLNTDSETIQQSFFKTREEAEAEADRLNKKNDEEYGLSNDSMEQHNGY